MDEWKPWLQALKPQHSPKSPMGKAVRYAINQWDSLTRFLDDPKLRLDDYVSESALRIVALGRDGRRFKVRGRKEQRSALRMAPQAFEEAQREETGRLHVCFPDRYVPFFVEGTMHTTLLGDNFGLPDILDDVVEFGGIDTSQVDGLTVAAWFRMMLDGDPRWAPVIE